MKKLTRPVIAMIAVLVVFLILLSLFLFSKTNSDKLPDNFYYGNIAISGLSVSEAASKIANEIRLFEAEGVALAYNDKVADLPAIAASFDSGLSYNNFQFDVAYLETKLAAHTRQSRLSAWLRKLRHTATSLVPAYTVNQLKIRDFIVETFPDSTNAAVDAAFVFSDKAIAIAEERPGKEVDWDNFFQELDKRLRSFDSSAIELTTRTDYPDIYRRDLGGLEKQADELTATDLTLVFQEKELPVSRGDIASWLAVNRSGSELALGFNLARIETYLEDTVAPLVNIEAQTPRFEIENDKVSSWQLGKEGYEIEVATSSRLILEQYVGATEPQTIDLAFTTIPSDETASFDIKEILGTGHSSFAGSPKNRRHNIDVGAAALHGLVIKPEEEFSLVKSLGNIDASGGYLPELVIKNNKTIPEYGGGLCQVGTTLFRSVLSTGLPVTARQNHSYRVSYYEPAGTDATIYDPWPDFRFINDTGKNILIQARVEGDDLYFDFWGTNDGRVATTTYPVIYNIVKPPPTKIIETDELKPGERKCTERAHNGADAWFDYTVIYPEGATTTPEVKRRFTSHYVPWQEVCLVGKTPEPVVDTETSATTTPDVVTSTPSN
ncbi:MAG: VanW family protein [bacterium]|nr:VanW family protein [bacterium]